MSTISNTSPTMATDQQLAALSQFTSNMSTHHDQATLYVLEDTSPGHHDGDHQHVRLFIVKGTVSPSGRCDIVSMR